jgi:hypothetical protein
VFHGKGYRPWLALLLLPNLHHIPPKWQSQVTSLFYFTDSDQPQPTGTPAIEPAPAQDPSPVEDSPQDEVAQSDEKPTGFAGIIEAAKGHATNAKEWIQSHPLQSALIGSGIAIGTAVAGWLIYKALKKAKGKKERSHPKLFDLVDGIKEEFPKNHLQRRNVIEEIDWNDPEFLEFLELFPDLDDLVE